MNDALYDLSPLAHMMLLGLALAAGPLFWVAFRKRGATPLGRLQSLTLVTLFLTFDLILFGAFTRLTDSGLGCPDWPGCYGSATPIGAHEEISQAQAAMPTGPVTHGKAWVEMVHRYLATSVGVLITALLIGSAWLWWRNRNSSRLADTVLLPLITFVWVCVQGAFGALTVTMKLFPAIVSLHLLGGYVLLALLVWQSIAFQIRQTPEAVVALGRGMRIAIFSALALLLLQAISGAWVSTNYAVLACTEFPACQGSLWPDMDFAAGFSLWRPLGFNTDGSHISFQALTAIHYGHRMLAGVTVLALGTLVWSLRKSAALRKPVTYLGMLLMLQVATGLSNVVLGWPLLAAVLHTGGAGAMVGVLVWLLAQTSTKVRAENAELRFGRLQAGLSE